MPEQRDLSALHAWFASFLGTPFGDSVAADAAIPGRCRCLRVPSENARRLHFLINFHRKPVIYCGIVNNFA
jgi:hypothetical protein